MTLAPLMKRQRPANHTARWNVFVNILQILIIGIPMFLLGYTYRMTSTSGRLIIPAQLFACPPVTPCTCDSSCGLIKPEDCPKPKTVKSSISDGLLSDTHFNHAYSFPREQVFSSVYAQGPDLGGSDSALLLTRITNENDTTFLEAAGECHELNIVFSNKLSCVAVVQNSGGLAPGFVYRYLPVKVNDTKVKYEWNFTPRVKRFGKVFPGDSTYATQEKQLMNLFAGKESFELRLGILLNSIANDDGVVVMAVNQGNLDILMNLFGSALAHDISMSNWLVFAADDIVREAVENLGIAAFYDPGLGDFPDRAANSYGDRTFSRMMWLKVVSVFLVNDMGYNVLFQDVDVVWYQEPFELFNSPEYLSFDTLWMDDGARSERFSPFFGNTGFYYIRHNERTRLMMREILFSNHLIETHYSHQAVVSQIVAEQVTNSGLTFVLLKESQFPQGRVYHHNKKLMSKIISGEHIPYVFHMCWTSGRKQKVQYFQSSGMWYLKDKCTQHSVKTHAGNKAWLHACFNFNSTS